MSVVPQLDFDFYPSQVFWFLCTFLLLYFVVQRVVVPKLELTIGRRLASQDSALDGSLDRCVILQGELLLQQIAIKNAELRAQHLVEKVQVDVRSMVEEASDLLKNELDGMVVAVDEMLGEQREKEQEELVTLSTEVAVLYCSKMGIDVNDAKRRRLRQLVTELYGERLC